MDEKKKVTALFEHSYRQVEKNLDKFETHELETLCFNIEVELRRRRFNDGDLNINFPYEWAEHIEITYPLDLTQKDEDD